MKREIFNNEHEMFRRAVRQFVEKEVLPYHADWEAAGQVPRDIWLKAGAAGFLCMAVPEAYGGLGERDFRYNLIMTEEFMRVHATGPGFSLQTDVVTPYLLNYGTEEQKRRWLPGMVRGETITAIAMTEPDAGSDLAGIRTTAVRHPHPDGDYYLLNGQKTFITNGILNDLVIVAAKTDLEARHSGLTLLLVERGMEGYSRGRNLERSAGTPRTRPNSSSRTCACRSPTAWATRGRASSTWCKIWRRSGSPSPLPPSPRRRPPWT
jgi:alkylation response protein AidB-like acyl-CoA dehydrogenase